MFYTKIPRKSLALLLISLIFTLAAVGIMFIIYFFNANNSLFMKPLLKQIYTESYHHYQQQQQQQQQMKQHRAYAQNYNTKDTDGISYQPYGIGINTHMIKYLKKDTKHHQMKNTFQQGGSDEDGMHEIEVNDDNNNNNGKNNNYYTNSDTIYIDDYDRNDKIDWNNNNNKLNNKYINNNNNDNADNDLLGINNIDYFETIIMDHKKSSTHNNNNNDNNNNKSNNNNHYNNNIINKSEKMIATQASINSGGGGGNDEDILIFTKSLNNRRNKLNKIKENSLRNNNIINKKDNIIHNNNSDDENRDNETIGSGSGDFIDDTELDEDIFIKTKPRLRPLRRNKLRNQKNHRISGGIERRSDINISSNESPPPIDAISKETALPSSYSTLSSSSLLTSALSSSSSLDITMPTVSSLSLLPQLTSSMQPIQLADNRKTRINKLDRKPSISSFSGKKWMPPSIVSSREVAAKMADDTTNAHREYQNGAWLETRARRIMGNVKKSEEKSRQLLLCEEAGGGELCRMLFKGYLNE